MIFVYFQGIVLSYTLVGSISEVLKKKTPILDIVITGIVKICYIDNMIYNETLRKTLLKKNTVKHRNKNMRRFTCKLKLRDIWFYMQAGEQGQRSLSFIYLFLQRTQLGVHPLLREQKEKPLYCIFLNK